VDWNNPDRVRDQQRDFLNEVMKSKVTQNAGDILAASRTISFSRRTLLNRATSLVSSFISQLVSYYFFTL